MNLHAKGRSRDISERGAFVFASNCPPLGVKIGLRISLPEYPGIAQGLRVDIEGRVLRVDRAGGEPEACGFAVSSDEAMLMESGEHAKSEPEA
jgi:hypothetical protein